MRPDNEIIKAELPPGASARALVKPDHDYLVYIRTGLGDWKKHPERKVKFNARELPVHITLPPGQWIVEWFDTKSGSSIEQIPFTHTGGRRTLLAPAFEDDVALTVRKK